MKIVYNKENHKQLEFVNDFSNRSILFLAGRGSGKTYGGALKALRHMIVPDSVGMIVAPSYKQLAVAQNVLWDIMWNAEVSDTEREQLESLQRDKHQPIFVKSFNKQENDLETTFNSIVHFRSGTDPDALRGYSLNWCWIDEPALMDEKVLWNIKLTLRRENSNRNLTHTNPKQAIPNQYWLTTTPKGYNWLYHTMDSYKLYTATTYDNRHNLPQEFLDELPTAGSWYEQEVLGRFVELDGIVFSSDDYEVGKLDLEKIYRKADGLDFGYTAPTAYVRVGLWGDVVYVYDGWEQTGLTTSDIYQKIINNEKSATPIYADPSLPSNIEDLRRQGLNITAANNDILYGIDAIKRKRLVINPECEELLAQLKTYSWDIRRGKPIKGFDHSIDAMRYAIAALTTKRTIKARQLDWFNNDAAIYARLAEGGYAEEGEYEFVRYS